MPGSSDRRRPPPTPRRISRDHSPPPDSPEHNADRLWDTLVHLGDLHFASLSAESGSPVPDPLRPKSKVAIMPDGKYCTHYPPDVCPFETFPMDIRIYPAPSRERASFSGGAAGLPYAPQPPKIRDIAYDVFTGHTLSISGHSVPAGRLSTVPRNALDAGSTGFADSVMRLVRGYEDFLCPGTPLDVGSGDASNATSPAGFSAPHRGPTGIYCERDGFGIRHYCVARAGTAGM